MGHVNEMTFTFLDMVLAAVTGGTIGASAVAFPLIGRAVERGVVRGVAAVETGVAEFRESLQRLEDKLLKHEQIHGHMPIMEDLAQIRADLAGMKAAFDTEIASAKRFGASANARSGTNEQRLAEMERKLSELTKKVR